MGGKNPTIGHVACPMCGEAADVRCSTKGKLYLYCAPVPGKTRGCGLIQPGYDGGQEWIRSNAKWLEGFERYGEAPGTPAPTPPAHAEPAGGGVDPEPEPEAEPEPEQEKKKGLRAWLELD